MKKGFLIILLLLTMAIPAIAAPTNASGPWGIDASGFRNLSSALMSPATAGKTVIVSKPMAINNKTLPSDRLIKITKGGRIEPASGKTFNFNGQNPEADVYKIFGGSGTITGLGIARPEWFADNTVPGATDMTSGLQAAFNTKALVKASGTSYAYTSLVIPSGSIGFEGVGYDSSPSKPSTKLVHIAGTGTISWDGSNRITNAIFKNFYLQGTGNASETYGLNLSGFSYCRFENIYIRLFTLDGIYTDGAITPVNKQFSNNTFINIRSNNNNRDGLRLDSSAAANNENGANSFLGCEFGGNGGTGINELYAESNNYIGCIVQSNTTMGIAFNGRSSIYQGYVEESAKHINFGSASERCKVEARSSYPLWNSFVDSGLNNIFTLVGRQQPETHLFEDPYFMRFAGTSPVGITSNGTITIGTYADTGSLADAGISVTVDAAFEGLILSLNKPLSYLAGKWVTVIVEADTSGLGALSLNQRLYTRRGATLNGNTGEFATDTIPITAAGVYKRFAFDVKFGADDATVPTIIWYLSYAAPGGTAVINIRSIHIVEGQTRDCAQYLGVPNKPIITTTALLQSKTAIINLHRKYAGKIVYNSTNGKSYSAIGTTDVSVWRATDGSGDLTPV